MTSVVRSEDKNELLQLAAASGSQVDQSIVGVLVELLSLGAQPKLVVEYLKLLTGKTDHKSYSNTTSAH